jgi:xylitol oxidase
VNKRTFLKILSALSVAPAISRVLVWASTKLTNWSGNVEFGTEKLASARSLDEVKDFVRKTPKLKALGRRHSFNAIANSTDQFISLTDMQSTPSLDSSARTVTVPAGMTYGQLCPFLDQHGWAIHNLASLPHISVAGACSTGTHGSGQGNGNLSTAASGLELVNAAGEVVTLQRDRDKAVFPGAVVSLGALGVITKVTLDIQPRFLMQQYVYQDLPLRALQDHFDEIQSAAYSVSLFTDWQNQRINEVWLKIKMQDDKRVAIPAEFFGAKRARRKLHPIEALSAEACTEQMGVPGPWYDRLPHFRMGFTPSAGRELQTEYFVPREHAIDAILAVDRLHDQVGPNLLITEIRTIAADDLWLSPCYKRASVTIHFTWKPDWPHVSRLLPVIERELAPYRPRPHWAKLFSINPSQLHASYEKLPDFVKLCSEYDSHGKFRNEFLNTNIFSS